MAEMNPFNYVRLQPMTAQLRRPPLGHRQFYDQAQGTPGGENNGIEEVYSGRLGCTVTAFSPLLVLSHDKAGGDLVVERNDHKRFNRFFHYPGDERPVIPATALKGMVRAIGEAAVNGCLSILSEETMRIWSDPRAAELQSLRFCGHPLAPDVLTTTGAIQLCPTCRLFGSAPEGKESGTDEEGAYPRAFQSKVRFSDALLQDESQDIYMEQQILIALLGPKAPTTVQYDDPVRHYTVETVPGRKFYYHHDDLNLWLDPDHKAKKINATVTPLKSGAVFRFQIDFRNLLESELGLLLYALELEPAQSLIQANAEQVNFDWQRVAAHAGIYPKLGYGKPAGLGSVCLLVDELQLLDPKARYSSKPRAWSHHLRGEAVRPQIQRFKIQFLRSQQQSRQGTVFYATHLAELRQILRFPNGIADYHYFQRIEQPGQKILRLPFPGHEAEWKG